MASSATAAAPTEATATGSDPASAEAEAEAAESRPRRVVRCLRPQHWCCCDLEPRLVLDRGREDEEDEVGMASAGSRLTLWLWARRLQERGEIVY